MRTSILPLSTLLLALTVTANAAHAASLPEAATALGVNDLKSIEFSGTGHWFQFGQAPNPNEEWPQFDISAYDATLNYEIVGSKIDIKRKQVIDPKRARPAPVEQVLTQFVSGRDSWNVTPPAANAAPGTPPTTTPQPLTAEERLAEIWETPQGFIKAALANNATSKDLDKGYVEVSFTLGGKYKYVGTINPQNQICKVQTWIDSPVLGDTLVETKYTDYKDFGGVNFPVHITRTQGGFPVLALGITDVKANPPIDITVPGVVVNYQTPSVVDKKLAEGVYYLVGGTHHSLAIEEKDHVVLVEAPLNEDRSVALIAKVHELFPNKPIKYVINTHHHFDHSGGLRTFVAQGATLVVPQIDKAYYEKIWANPHTINPDQLSQNPKPAKFKTYGDKLVLTEGGRKIEIHEIAGSGHSDGFGLIYLPAEKILVEGDAFTPGPVGAPAPTTVNPYALNLYQNIERLKLNVDQIAAIHGPRVATLADLKAYIGQ